MKLRFPKLLVFLAASPFLHAKEASVIRFSGTDSLGLKVVPQLAGACGEAGGREIRPDIRMEGSSTAFSDLIGGTADIGMSARMAKPEEKAAAAEKGVTLQEFPACHTLIAVVVHPENPVRNLTVRQVEAIFTGDVTDWREVGGEPGKITVYHRNNSSAMFMAWKTLAMNGRDYAPASKSVAPGEIPALMAGDRGGITYMGGSSREVAAVAIDGVAAEPENSARYPYVNRYFWITGGKPSPAAVKFLEFSRSKEARVLMKKLGFIPG